MPPRFAYWTIIIDDAPTAFRARDREELVPTYRQLLTRNPNATIKWFARGKLWESPEQARAAVEPPREPRGPDWRPGGRHEDPRARFDKRPGKRHPARTGSREGKPHGKPAFGKRAADKPAFCKPTAGRPSFGKPGNDKRAFGKPRTHKPPYGKPRPDKAAFGKRAAEREGGPRKTYNPNRPKGGFKRPFGGRQDQRKRFAPRDSRAERRTNDTPNEAEPPVQPPPRPPGPDRPPKPGHEPGPNAPEPETIRILPEPPERAK